MGTDTDLLQRILPYQRKSRIRVLNAVFTFPRTKTLKNFTVKIVACNTNNINEKIKMHLEPT